MSKLSNFNFQWTETLYQNILSDIAFFFTLFKGYRYLTILFLEPKWALSQYSIRPSASWAIDSEAMRARGIIVLVKLVGQKYQDKTTLVS